ncbi:MAG: T9SS C-terminal target domain-containing protein, partial [bacterium]
MFRKYAILLLFLLLPVLAAAQTVVDVTDADIPPGSDVVWTSDNAYVLNGFVFVDSSATLTIEPGTVIKGKPGQGENASALIVARGGQIFANGTPTQPIIFTAEADDVNDPNDLPLDARGLWGGLIILGRAGLNSTPGQTAIEGIPTTEIRGLYGGNDDADNSGVIRYVSIRYGGTDIGAGNEINGLTLGGVGRGTQIEFVEVFNNADDGFEFFGGTVNTRYLVSAFNGDDSFDYDEGFRGKGQFWFAIQAEDIGNRAGEHDGGTNPEDGRPFAIPQIYNATYIGSGASSSNLDNDVVLKIRDNAGGKYKNSIFTDFADRGVDVEDLASGEDSRARLEAGDLVLANNLWWGFGAGNDFASIAPQDFVQAHLTANNNQMVDPQLGGISRTNDRGLDPRPGSGSPALTGAASVPAGDDFLKQTDYLGAFGPGDLWVSGWTFLSKAGFVAARGANVVNITDADIPPGSDVVWTSDNA